MDEDELFDFVQTTVTGSTITIVGSGLSCAAGLPSMRAIADQLQAKLPSSMANADKATWKNVEAKLKSGKDLESALKGVSFSDVTLDAIRRITASLVETGESAAISSFAKSADTPIIGKLSRYICESGRVSHVVTSNYDRLVEYACSHSGLPVDTGVVGAFLGHFDPAASREEMSTHATKDGKRLRKDYKRHVRVYKPHGCLSWYQSEDRVFATQHSVDCKRLIITPGLNKYKEGYRSEFDAQRSAANKAIESASSVVVIGYGFNDDQLEHAIRTRFAAGTPGLILARTLTSSARELVGRHPTVVAVESADDSDAASLCWQGGHHSLLEGRFWDASEIFNGALNL